MSSASEVWFRDLHELSAIPDAPTGLLHDQEVARGVTDLGVDSLYQSPGEVKAFTSC